MPRQSRGRSSSTTRSAPSQTRGAHTAAIPGGYAQPHAPKVATNTSTTQPQQPGLLAQMAATAGSVAIGSTIGHGISSMLFGGSNETAPAQAAAPVQNQQANLGCEFHAKEFSKCMEQADVNSCTWHLEQWKACQAAASPY